MHSPLLSPAICPPVAHRIWSSPDAVLLFFAGGAAEFAALKAVDWLFFTNALPTAPIERFSETVHFAQRVFCTDPQTAATTIAIMNRIHRQVEAKRGRAIPAWAYRDVLFIVLHYGEVAHTVVFGPLAEADRLAYFAAVMTLGQAMALPDLPATYAAYQQQRHQQLVDDYAPSVWTERLNRCYRVALGRWRYWLLRRVQASVIPDELRGVLGLRRTPLITGLLSGYRYLPGGGNKLCPLHGLLLPHRFAGQVRALARDGPGKPEHHGAVHGRVV
jgi:hypothetical protein